MRRISPLPFLPLHRPLLSSIHDKISDKTSFSKLSSMWIQIMHKTSGGRRPKKKIYHRVHELDKAMDLQKKPSVILKLKSIIQSQKNQSLLLRDLEKEVGFIQKWNYIAVIEKYPSIFHVSSGHRTPPAVSLTTKAEKIASEESLANELMEPILVNNLKKLLMLSVDCRIPLETIDLIQQEFGLPCDYKKSLIPKFPEFFSVKEICGISHLELETWDSSLAVTAREERFLQERISGSLKRARISKDGNFHGPFAFRLSFPSGFRPNMSYLQELEKWQKMDFPSPYLNAKRFEVSDPKARKRVVGVLHEVLSLTMEKRLTSGQLEAFHSELRLPARLLLCLIKHHGLFYITNKGAKSSVFLKEGYEGSRLVDKCPLLLFRDKFVSLSGRIAVEPSSSVVI
ncbi:hypothetical protein LXL04_036015 [Taraxacum kok-saghyz]